MRQVPGGGLILAVGRRGKPLGTNALILLRANGNFAEFRRVELTGLFAPVQPSKSTRRISLSEALRNFLFTSESVTEGHPDKIADQISDAVLDEVMRQEPMGRVACETLVTTGHAGGAGAITTTAHMGCVTLVRGTLPGEGCGQAKCGYDR